MDYQITGAQIIDVLSADGCLCEVTKDFENLVFKSITYNSRLAGENGLFLCMGASFKVNYLLDAAARGAVGYVSEMKYDAEIPCIVVSNVRRAMALIAKAFYEYVPGEFNLYGITGTKGKSTTTYFLVNVLEKARGAKPAFLTTVDVFDGEKYHEAKLTTPESLDSYEIFAHAKEHGCKDVVMELSSQSDKVQRIVGMQYQYGIFTNISDDHIAPNEHKDFEDYLSCKMNIVRRYENAVINKDDEHCADALLAAKDAKSCLTYSIHENAGADIYAKNIERDGYKTKFTAVTPTWEHEMEISIPGVFNVGNALAATGIAYMLGLEPEKIAEGLLMTQVDGRMNIYEKDGYVAIVDYAHNKASIHAAYEALRDYYPNRKIQVVFGCPGCKAFQRRRDMAEESAAFCDYIYITAEDPSFVDPMEVSEEIAKYATDAGGACEIIIDRKTAIKTAIERLKKDEILIVAGKGSEHYQVVNGVAEPYEGDTVLVKEYINKK